jgi:phosphate:Na+ symporter
MIVTMLFNLVGGLGLFLYGMGLMSDGLKKAAGQKLRQMLESMTKTPILGFTTGMLTTALVQSSSATTVMIIGLVNAGLLTLKQAVAVVLGTNVGTTITAWLVSLSSVEIGAFKITKFALPAIAVGFLMGILGKSRKTKNIGIVVLGFGLLFVGIGFMQEAFGGLKDNPAVQEWLASLSGNPVMGPLFGMFAGIAVTMLLQSSSASISIVLVLASQGVLGTELSGILGLALPFVLGANIGTTITAQIASIRANVGSRRTAWAHTMFNVTGTLIALPFVYTGLFEKAVVGIFDLFWQPSQGTYMFAIAIGHTLFNVTNSVLFLPFAGALERLVTRMIRPREGEVLDHPVVLEKHLLDTPILALQQAKREIIRMAQEAKKAVSCASEGLSEGDIKKIARTRKIEDGIDEFQNEITTYLVELSQRQLSDDVSIELPVLLHMVNDLERVGDHAVNIAEIAERKIEEKFTFSEAAGEESSEMVDEAYLMFDGILAALENNDVQAAHAALASENKLNRMQVNFRRSHVQRMTDGICSAQSGLIFIDLVDNVEKIGDHLTNIAQSVIGGVQWEGLDASTLSGQFEAQTGELD